MKDWIIKLFLLLGVGSLTTSLYPASESRLVLLPNSHILVCGGRHSASSGLSSRDCYLIYSWEYAASIGMNLTKDPSIIDLTDEEKDPPIYIYPNLLSTPRYAHTMTLLPNGKILVAGGFSDGTPSDTADIITLDYNVVNSTTRITVDMLSARANHTATLLTQGPDAGNVLICGGTSDGVNTLDSCEIFITSATSEPYFKPGPTLTSPREGHTASLLPNGKVFFAGGLLRPATYHLTTELYDPTNNSMTPGPSLLVGRSSHTAVTLASGYTLLIGGYNGFQSPDVFSKDSQEVQLAQAQHTNGYVDLVEIFDSNGARAPVGFNQINTGVRGQTDLFPYRMANHAALLLGDGSVYIAGGRGNIPVTYVNPEVVASEGSTLTLSDPEVPVATGTRRSSIASTNIKIKIPRIRLSRYVIGRLIEADWFIPSRSDGSPTAELSASQIFLGITTATLDTVFVGGDGNRGFGWLEEVEVPLQGPGSGAYVLFPPLKSVRSDDGYGMARLQISGSSLQPGEEADLLDTTTATLTLSFTMPAEYGGFRIVGATITLKSAFYMDDMLLVEFKGGRGEITDVNIGGEGEVGVSVDFSNVIGFVYNTTTTAITFPRNISGRFTNISFDISYTVDGIRFVDDVSFSVDPSTIVVRDALFSNLARYYPRTNQLYLNDDMKTGVSNTPLINHSLLLRRGGGVIIFGGRNCEDKPALWCRRGSPTLVPMDEYSEVFWYFDERWKGGPHMKNKRAFHTLTALNDGSLLACGGTDGEKTLDTCERFDPRVGEWVIVATMTVARAYHSATLLPNGTVLLAGGTSGRVEESAALKDAEIFYPDVKKTVKTSPLNKARLLHTATLLPDGNVLFTGGTSSGAYLSSAELFITTANIFVEIGEMNQARSEHAATLLPNNTVLITGGLNGLEGTLRTCEIFDVNTRTFSPTDSMSVPRKAHTATLLDNGVVVVYGGSNNEVVVNTLEVYNPSTGQWHTLPVSLLRPTKEYGDNDVYFSRANHRAVLLPDKTVAYIGGETIDPKEVVRSVSEKLLTDNSYLSWFGRTERRIGTAVALAKNNYIVATGGFDGRNKYLDTMETLYYSVSQADEESLPSIIPRKPYISTATYIVDNGDTLVIYSTYSNLHSLVEASGSGSGPRNSDFSKPYIVLTSLNNDYSINLSTMLYVTDYNPSWNLTLSTISVKIPEREKAPYGWYYLHVCVEGNCSDPLIIQISTPRPQCIISTPTVIPTDVWTTSMSWSWNLKDIVGGTVANGFAVFSSSDIFISTHAFPSPPTAVTTFTLTGLAPNTPSALKVGCYNIGGFSDKKTWAVAVSTIHTRANPPKDLKITYASFDTVSLEWDGNGNSSITPYQVEVSTDSQFNPFSIAINFANNYTDTKATIKRLQPNWRYYFRVKARNGDKKETGYSNVVSTITVGNIVGLTGLPLSTDSIKWMWNPAGGATGYEIYEYRIIQDPNDPIFRSTIDASVLIATTSYNYYTWTGLNVNSPYQVKVRSFKIDDNTMVYGPFSVSPVVHTLASEPKPAYPNVFSEVTTGSIKITWDSNGNSTSTLYNLEVSGDEDFADYKSFEVLGDPKDFPFVSYVVGNLSPNTKYYARVYAINNDGIKTPTPAYLGSKYTLAQPPSWVYVSSVSLKGVVLNWETDDNPPYTIYQVRVTSVSFESPYVSTPVPFGMGYTSNTYLITGLWLNTTYYFDVTARNMEGIETLPMQTATPAFVSAGVLGSVPSGAIGNEVDPNGDTIIKGILADGRTIIATFYKGTFLTPQPVAIASLDEGELYKLTHSSNPCGYTFNGSTIAFGIFANAQPYIPVRFNFNYFSSEAFGTTGISSNYSKISLARYNPQTGQCLPVKTEIDTSNLEITSYLNHFSIYQLVMINPATSLDGIKVYPNPFYPNRPGQGHITIINLPSDAKLTFYTLTGTKVYETKANNSGVAYWDGRNIKGELVGSGVYICVVKSRYGTKRLKLAVER